MYLENEFCHFEGAVQFNSGEFNRNYMLTLSEFPAFRKKNRGHGLFTTAYRYDQEDIRQAKMIGDLYLDFDVSDINNDFESIRLDALRTISALKAIFGIERDSIEIYYSGNKGIHFVIPAEVLGIQPHDELHMIFKHIAVDLNKLTKHQTIDIRIYDKVRLFRVPNTYHPKSGLYKVPLTLENLQFSSLLELKEIASEPRKRHVINRTYSTQANRIYQDYIKQYVQEKKRIEARKHKGQASGLNFMPPCIQHIIDEGAYEGKRNNTVAVLASYFMQRGVTEAEALDRVAEWNEEQCVPQLPAREVSTTVTSIFRSQHRYGCSALRELSICSSSCKLNKDEGRNLNV